MFACTRDCYRCRSSLVKLLFRERCFCELARCAVCIGDHPSRAPATPVAQCLERARPSDAPQASVRSRYCVSDPVSITFDRFVSVARLRSAQELPPRCRGKGGAPPGWVALCEVGTSERARTLDRLGPLAPARQGKLDARFPSQPAGAAGAVAITDAYGGEGPARARQDKTRRRAARGSRPFRSL